MIDTIIKVSGTIPANTTTNDISAIDIPEDGEILCIGGIILGTVTITPGPRQNENIKVVAELSFLSTNQIGVNDARGTIAGAGVSIANIFSEAAETGGGSAKISEQGSICLPEGISVNAGERIHLHGLSNMAEVTGIATFVLYIKSKGGGRRATRRR